MHDGWSRLYVLYVLTTITPTTVHTRHPFIQTGAENHHGAWMRQDAHYALLFLAIAKVPIRILGIGSRISPHTPMPVTGDRSQIMMVVVLRGHA